MGKFLTDESIIIQKGERGQYLLLGNELYKDDDGVIYLAWKGFQTDNFTWLRSNDWDIRCSHIHDVACKHHQLVRVMLNEFQLRMLRILKVQDNHVWCKDIPRQFLKIVDVSGTEANNLFYRMLKAADNPRTPKIIQILYRIGVMFNFHWFFTGKEKINKDKIYKLDL